MEFEPEEDSDLVRWLTYLDQEVIFEPEENLPPSLPDTEEAA